MKKILLLGLAALILTGCTIVRIDTTSIDNILNVVLSKENTLYNRVGRGYKYYVPRGVTYIDSSGSNDKLYSNGVYYYLYLDEISYYYQKSLDYKEDDSKYYSRKIDNDGNLGYLEITKQDDLYLIEFVYNYARIEALVPEEDINDTVLNSSYILSTIKYNNNIVKLSLEDDFLQNKEEKYDVFSAKNQDDDSFLRYEEEGN
ncbi:unknown [Firmicutes bacterium CAG:822]|nr:unknown [Firmicutes bacterium CAG:822]